MPMLAENTDTTRMVTVATSPVANGLFVTGVTGSADFSYALGGGVLIVYLNAGVVLDYETKPHYEAIFTLSDSSAVGVSLDITDIDEAPTGIAFSAASIGENNAAGATVATLDATDPDHAGSGFAGPFTFALATGVGDTDNAAFTVSGDRLSINSRADFETKASYSVRLEVTDAGGSSFVTVKTITVNDVSPEVLIGTAGVDRLSGGSDIDLISGLGGNDILSGLAGNDHLTGGRGRDLLTGGAGSDVFHFNGVGETGNTAATRDRIADFTHGFDDIDLSAIDANGSAIGNPAFKFLGAKGAPFTGMKGQLHWYQVDHAGKAHDITIVEGDINGDRHGDFQIELAGLKTLGVGDFLL